MFSSCNFVGHVFNLVSKLLKPRRIKGEAEASANLCNYPTKPHYLYPLLRLVYFLISFIWSSNSNMPPDLAITLVSELM